MEILCLEEQVFCGETERRDVSGSMNSVHALIESDRGGGRGVQRYVSSDNSLANQTLSPIVWGRWCDSSQSDSLSSRICMIDLIHVPTNSLT